MLEPPKRCTHNWQDNSMATISGIGDKPSTLKFRVTVGKWLLESLAVMDTPFDKQIVGTTLRLIESLESNGNKFHPANTDNPNGPRMVWDYPIHGLQKFPMRDVIVDMFEETVNVGGFVSRYTKNRLILELAIPNEAYPQLTHIEPPKRSIHTIVPG